MKNDIQDYTEAEFLAVVEHVYSDNSTDEEVEDLVHFFNNTQYPRGSTIITHPDIIGIKDQPVAIVEEIKRWYSQNNLTCFKEE